MMEDNDKLITQFFAQHRQTIANDGFSQEVMRRVSSRAVRQNKMWVALCWCLGIILFFFFNGIATVQVMLLHIGKDLFGIISAVDLSSCNPFIFYIGLCTLALVGAYNVAMQE